MQQYKDLITELLTAENKEDRTGTGTLSKFGHTMRFDLQKGFPLVTLKKTPFHLIVKELLWFLQGNTNAHDLAGQKCHIWDQWALDDGDLGPIYGKQWRSWEAPNVNTLKEQVIKFRKAVFYTQCDMDDVEDEISELERAINNPPVIDQIAEVIHTLKLNPDIKDIDGFTLTDIELLNYTSHAAIKGRVSV